MNLHAKLSIEVRTHMRRHLSNSHDLPISCYGFTNLAQKMGALKSGSLS